MVGRLLCEWLKWHDYTNWEMGSSTQWQGMKPKEVSDQRRECIRCGWHEVKVIKDKLS